MRATTTPFLALLLSTAVPVSRASAQAPVEARLIEPAPAPASTPPARAPAVTATGPRVAVRLDVVPQTMAAHSSSRAAVRGNHTVTISTLVLVLAVVILVLLIA